MTNAESREEIRAALRALHEQLGGLHDVQPETATLLRTVAEDIDRALDEATDDEGSPDLLSRWREAMLEFEGRHPKLAQAVDQLATALANMGL